MGLTLAIHRDSLNRHERRKYAPIFSRWCCISHDKALGALEEVLKGYYKIRINVSEQDCYVIYEETTDGLLQEVLDLVKEYRPELYYEIMLGIKQ